MTRCVGLRFVLYYNVTTLLTCLLDILLTTMFLCSDSCVHLCLFWYLEASLIEMKHSWMYNLCGGLTDLDTERKYHLSLVACTIHLVETFNDSNMHTYYFIYVYIFGRYLRSSKNNCIFECMIVVIFSGKEDHTVWHRIKLFVDILHMWNQSITYFQGFFVLPWTTHFFVQDDIVCHFLEAHDAIIKEYHVLSEYELVFNYFTWYPALFWMHHRFYSDYEKRIMFDWLYSR